MNLVCFLSRYVRHELLELRKAAVALLQGDPVWAISPATITGVLDLSFNFFYVLPLLNLCTRHSDLIRHLIEPIVFSRASLNSHCVSVWFGQSSRLSSSGGCSCPSCKLLILLTNSINPWQLIELRSIPMWSHQVLRQGSVSAFSRVLLSTMTEFYFCALRQTSC